MKKSAEQLRTDLKLARAENIIALLDSGAEEKLERYGIMTLRRPSSLCIWQKRQAAKFWDSANANYIPKSAWRCKNSNEQNWEVDLKAFKLNLSLQDNGQIGCFPEHLEYFDLLSESISQVQTENQEVKILNLFAYTGMASTWCALHDCKVTHVEIAKRVIEWAKDNIALNNIPKENLRYIAEDALAFTQREVRRNSKYDIIIADPPSFSRLSKNSTWELEKIANSFIKDLLSLLKPGGFLFFTSHHQLLSSHTIANLILDQEQDKKGKIIKKEDLFLVEANTQRTIPAGNLVIYRG